MLQSQLVNAIAAKTGRTPELIDSVGATIFQEIIAQMLAGNEVEIEKFGTFSRRYLKPRQGYNPAKGVKIKVGASYRPDFKFNGTFGKEFSAKLENEPAPTEKEVEARALASIVPPPPPPAPLAPPAPPPPPPAPPEPTYHVSVNGQVSQMKRSEIPAGSMVYNGSEWITAETFLTA